MFHKVKKIEHENFDFVLLLSFFLSFFSITHNSKSIRRIRMFYIPNDCCAIGDFLFWVRAACEQRLASYGPKYTTRSPSYATRSLSDTPTQHGLFPILQPHHGRVLRMRYIGCHEFAGSKLCVYVGLRLLFSLFTQSF